MNLLLIASCLQAIRSPVTRAEIDNNCQTIIAIGYEKAWKGNIKNKKAGGFNNRLLESA